MFVIVERYHMEMFYTEFHPQWLINMGSWVHWVWWTTLSASAVSNGAYLLEFLRVNYHWDTVSISLHRRLLLPKRDKRHKVTRGSRYRFSYKHEWSPCSSLSYPTPYTLVLENAAGQCLYVRWTCFILVKPVGICGLRSCILFCVAYVRILAYLDWKARPIIHEQVHLTIRNSNTTGLYVAHHRPA